MNRTPGISPFALPLRPKPARRTSSFSSTKLRQPSLGTVLRYNRQHIVHSKYPASRFAAMLRLQGIGGVRTERGDLLAVLDQLDSDTLSDSLQHRRLEAKIDRFVVGAVRTELGCLASTPTFSRTIPLAWDDPPNGLSSIVSLPSLPPFLTGLISSWRRTWT